MMTSDWIEVHLAGLPGRWRGVRGRAMLSDEERRIAAGIASRSRRTSFLAGRLFVRRLLAHRLGCTPEEVPIVRRADGKPRLDHGGIEFSLSHTEGWIAVALATGFEVGVDAELIRPLAGMREIASAYFPPDARAEFAASLPDNQPAVFFRWWTRIEAAGRRGPEDLPLSADHVTAG